MPSPTGEVFVPAENPLLFSSPCRVTSANKVPKTQRASVRQTLQLLMIDTQRQTIGRVLPAATMGDLGDSGVLEQLLQCPHFLKVALEQLDQGKGMTHGGKYYPPCVIRPLVTTPISKSPFRDKRSLSSDHPRAGAAGSSPVVGLRSPAVAMKIEPRPASQQGAGLSAGALAGVFDVGGGVRTATTSAALHGPAPAPLVAAKKQFLAIQAIPVSSEGGGFPAASIANAVVPNGKTPVMTVSSASTTTPNPRQRIGGSAADSVQGVAVGFLTTAVSSAPFPANPAVSSENPLAAVPQGTADAHCGCVKNDPKFDAPTPDPTATVVVDCGADVDMLDVFEDDVGEQPGRKNEQERRVLGAHGQGGRGGGESSVKTKVLSSLFQPDAEEIKAANPAEKSSGVFFSSATAPAARSRSIGRGQQRHRQAISPPRHHAAPVSVSAPGFSTSSGSAARAVPAVLSSTSEQEDKFATLPAKLINLKNPI